MGTAQHNGEKTVTTLHRSIQHSNEECSSTHNHNKKDGGECADIRFNEFDSEIPLSMRPIPQSLSQHSQGQEHDLALIESSADALCISALTRTLEDCDNNGLKSSLPRESNDGNERMKTESTNSEQDIRIKDEYKENGDGGTPENKPPMSENNLIWNETEQNENGKKIFVAKLKLIKTEHYFAS